MKYIYIYDIVQTSELYFNFQFSSLPNSYLVSGNAVLEFVLFAILLLVNTCTWLVTVNDQSEDLFLGRNSIVDIELSQLSMVKKLRNALKLV